MNPLLPMNKNISIDQITPSPCTIYQVNQLLKKINQLETTIENQNQTILDQQNQLDHSDMIIYQKDEMIRKNRNTIKNERNKKRELITFLCEYGFCNQFIRQSIGSFEYSAEIRKYNIQRITKLDNGENTYIVGQKLGQKTFYFTNSSNTILDLSQLDIVHVGDFTQTIKCKFIKDDNNNNCSNINNYYNYHKNNNKFRHNKYGHKNGDKYNHNSNSTDMIYPGDHFYVTFMHPISTKTGWHKLSYRLYSHKKANTCKTSKKNEKGAFGQTIKFAYEVKPRDRF